MRGDKDIFIRVAMKYDWDNPREIEDLSIQWEATRLAIIDSTERAKGLLDQISIFAEELKEKYDLIYVRLSRSLNDVYVAIGVDSRHSYEYAKYLVEEHIKRSIEMPQGGGYPVTLQVLTYGYKVGI